ncbi:FkbM family methyltransferase [Bradyrhizobium canariense]|uniref:FkbM family methyltransferase n=1 Tax=Bradyrhizobium canariense TaxID=255045 RepID=UPI0013021A30|nr:FkbM family methyltransferase [Bradyrhizobium canariense]
MPVNDLIGQRIIGTGSFELTQFDAVDQLISDPRSLLNMQPDLAGAFVDVGANIGLYTTRYAPSFERTFAIEANPATFHILQANVAMARSPHVEALCIGASNRTGSAEIHVAQNGMLGWSSLSARDDLATYPVSIKLDLLDNILSGARPRIALMKIDIEGHELEALEGSFGTIQKDGPIILFEALSPDAAKASINLLRRASYQRFYAFSRLRNFRSLVNGLPVTVAKIDPESPAGHALICAIP